MGRQKQGKVRSRKESDDTAEEARHKQNVMVREEGE